MALEWKISDQTVDYPYAMNAMEERAAAIFTNSAEEQVWLLEHEPLYTAGTSADPSDLLDPDRFPVYDAGRGGQYTYHGPGQRVVYFMLNLNERGKDLRKFIWNLEEVIIQTLDAFQVKGERRDGRVGIWVKRDNGREDKIAAIGVRVRKWVTFHGIAINVDPDLSHFNGIVPCGIESHGVTSLHDLGHILTLEDVDVILKEKFETIMGMSPRPMMEIHQAVPADSMSPIVRSENDDILTTNPVFQL
ncbi:lipoyl(octanoyl) transferase LipB [Temperatibacter marinus]|uniref:Octanoyltransferase n=1 Tax=Temperatibacter marinus TaxID=1456591 RepID=A0AA52EHT0_9PROT|nr:lipoyl(octanoyl) transferase LipB [Temperatibacter marinus]WND02764.1 lipoyl(octanoyl) transferase LipB [Temperatibacter marinus]